MIDHNKILKVMNDMSSHVFKSMTGQSSDYEKARWHLEQIQSLTAELVVKTEALNKCSNHLNNLSVSHRHLVPNVLLNTIDSASTSIAVKDHMARVPVSGVGEERNLMITITYSSKQELYDLVFDMPNAGHEYLCGIPKHLREQYINSLDNLVHYNQETDCLWRMNAWKCDYEYWQKQKSKSAADTKRWNLMKDAAKELRKRLGLDYEVAWQLVQDLCRKKSKLFFDAAGFSEDKWKGLME